MEGCIDATRSRFLTSSSETSKAAINDFFLEEAGSGEAFCLKWLKAGASVARRRGSAVVIGHHYHRTTLDCLKKGLPSLAAQGVDVVPISALVH